MGNVANNIEMSVDRTTLHIPLFEWPVRAGFPSPAEDHVEDTLDPSTYLVQNDISTFFVRVRGDSMIDAMIFDGDVLVVDRSITPQIGNIVLAEIDGEFTVKYLGRRQLLPANRKHAPIDIADDQTLTVLGVVTGSMRRFL